MKKFFSFFFTVLILSCLFSICAYADVVVSSPAATFAPLVILVAIAVVIIVFVLKLITRKKK